MAKLREFWRENKTLALAAIFGLAAVAYLMLHKLGSLVGGLSAGEVSAATASVGWHGIYHDPFYLPLKLVRSLVFFLEPDHGQILTRLPNAFFGGLTVVAFGWLAWLWHGTRTAVLITLLFACSGWTLHTSRLAGNEVMYYWGITTLLLIQVLLHRWGHKAIVWYSSLMFWGAMLYVPGMFWLVGLQIYSQRHLVGKVWGAFVTTGHRFLSSVVIVFCLPLLLLHLTRPGRLAEWIGLPADWPSLLHLGKQFAGVFVHLFIRGPQYPDQWLGRAPILDAFTLLCAGLGIYFYASHLNASRSRTLAYLFIAGYILVGLGGAVGLSVIVPIIFIAAAAGLAYLLQAWLKVFPFNPFARGLGIGLVGLAVMLSCAYNLRAYFTAWPHNSVTKETFIYNK